MSKTSHKKHESIKRHTNAAPSDISEEDVFTEHRLGSEVLIALIIFAMGLFFMVPIYSSATVSFQSVLLAIFVLSILAFVVTHWRRLKKQKDHPAMPLMERFVYLSVVSVLALAVVIQFLTKTLDVWLVAILIFIVLLKVLLTARLGRK